MIIVKLQGGLGNQMFQYAAGRSLAVKHNTQLKVDVSQLLDRSPSSKIVFRDFDLDIFPKIAVAFATQQECIALTKKSLIEKLTPTFFQQSLIRSTHLKEKSFSFQKSFSKAGPDTYLDGYWQSEKYFSEITQMIRDDFSFKPLNESVNVDLMNEIQSKNSVCLNVRRGDFVSHDGSASFHGFKGLDYINAAADYMQQRVPNLCFFIFSDDIAWCKENIKLSQPSTLVDHSHAGEKFSDYLQLMSACKHFIIPNSSFGWWAAWLSNKQTQIVVTPKHWFNDSTIDTTDLIPPGWIRL